MNNRLDSSFGYNVTDLSIFKNINKIIKVKEK